MESAALWSADGIGGAVVNRLNRRQWWRADPRVVAKG
jgi:Ni,Fe-hydrogenase maturation factor